MITVPFMWWISQTLLGAWATCETAFHPQIILISWCFILILTQWHTLYSHFWLRGSPTLTHALCFYVFEEPLTKFDFYSDPTYETVTVSLNIHSLWARRQEKRKQTGEQGVRKWHQNHQVSQPSFSSPPLPWCVCAGIVLRADPLCARTATTENTPQTNSEDLHHSNF